MEKLEKLEKYVRIPDVSFYGTYIYDGVDRELHNEKVTEGDYTLEIIDIVENGIFKKHKTLTNDKGLKEEEILEYPLKENDTLSFVENMGFTKVNGLIPLDKAIDKLKLLKDLEVKDDTKRDEG